jgi:hypothetical protein
MKNRFFSAIVFGFVLTFAAIAQDAPTAPSTGQPSDQESGPGGRQGQGQPGGRRGMGGMGAGGGVTGTVTEVAADHYTIKTDAGESYTIHVSADTRIMKQTMQRRGEGAEGRGGFGGGTPPESLKPGDVKVGDVVAALGSLDAASKTITAMAVVQIDPERAKEMREMQANYGKTWLQGKVTAINETTVTLMGSVDNAAHAFVADENTTFRKRRAPITLADMQVGDMVRVEGAVKGGSFVAASVNVMGMPPGGTPTVPRGAQAVPDSR